MDDRLFDHLTRLLAAAQSRRAALGSLLGAVLLVPLHGEGKELRRDRRRRGKDARQRGGAKGHRRTGAQAALAGCNPSTACSPGHSRNLAKCDLEGSTALKNASCKGCNFNKANLRGADWRDADLSGVNLNGACLVDANFAGATFKGVNTNGAIFCRTTMPDGSVNDSGCNAGTKCCPTAPCPDGLKRCANGSCQVCCNSGDCQGRACCRGTCCAGNEVCSTAGSCCARTKSACAPGECGTFADGCGGSVACGSCADGFTCSNPAQGGTCGCESGIICNGSCCSAPDPCSPITDCAVGCAVSSLPDGPLPGGGICCGGVLDKNAECCRDDDGACGTKEVCNTSVDPAVCCLPDDDKLICTGRTGDVLDNCGRSRDCSCPGDDQIPPEPCKPVPLTGEPGFCCEGKYCSCNGECCENDCFQTIVGGEPIDEYCCAQSGGVVCGNECCNSAQTGSNCENPCFRMNPVGGSARRPGG